MPKESPLGMVLLPYVAHGPQPTADAQEPSSGCSSLLPARPLPVVTAGSCSQIRFLASSLALLSPVSLGSTQMHAIVFQPTLKTLCLQLVP